MLRKVRLAVENFLVQDLEPCKVEAHVYGKLAVHRHIKDSKAWNITHIPSGARITPAITFRKACTLAKAAQSLDWDFGTFGDRELALRQMPEATAKGFPTLFKKLCGRNLYLHIGA